MVKTVVSSGVSAGVGARVPRHIPSRIRIAALPKLVKGRYLRILLTIALTSVPN